VIDKLTLLYLMFGVRWAFEGRSWVDVVLDLVAMCKAFVVCVTAVGWLFTSDYERAELTPAQPECERAGDSVACHFMD
jgi:hypothetical protein